MMQTISSISALRHVLKPLRQAGLRIGFVPTMGALHAGHLSLIGDCRKHADCVVASIFVNPTQFAPHEDLAKYPRPLERDLQLCAAAGVDVVFLPTVEELYPPGFCSWVTVEGVSAELEGAIRPDHFRGVATVVAKLFQIVQPTVACFGAKDYQQQTVIRRMVLDLDLPIEIVVCPTFREDDGLAMSSRNIYLTTEQRKSALSLSQGLIIARNRLHARSTDLRAIERAVQEFIGSHDQTVVDYVRIADPDSLAPLLTPQRSMVVLVAARVGLTRLIDNTVVELPENAP